MPPAIIVQIFELFETIGGKFDGGFAVSSTWLSVSVVADSYEIAEAAAILTQYDSQNRPSRSLTSDRKSTFWRAKRFAGIQMDASLETN